MNFKSLEESGAMPKFSRNSTDDKLPEIDSDDIVSVPSSGSNCSENNDDKFNNNFKEDKLYRVDLKIANNININEINVPINFVEDGEIVKESHEMFNIPELERFIFVSKERAEEFKQERLAETADLIRRNMPNLRRSRRNSNIYLKKQTTSAHSIFYIF